MSYLTASPMVLEIDYTDFAAGCCGELSPKEIKANR
jgi:hypothetical protein